MKLKLYLTFFVCLFASALLKAQSPSDAIRFSFTNYGGTARYQAIGGTMGSLGGEFSAALVNPAGLGLYRTNEWLISPGFNFGNQKATYRGTLNNQSQNGNFNLGSSGALWSFSDKYHPEESFTVSVGVTQTANFKNSTVYKGFNNISSQSEVFLEDLADYGANGGFSNVSQYMNDIKNGYGYLRLGGTLAYNTGLVDSMIDRSVDPNQFNWLSKMKDSVTQSNVFDQKGGIYDLFGAFGGSIDKKNKWFLGGTFALNFLSYTRERTFLEEDATVNKRAGVNAFTFTDYSNTTGLGLTGKIGVIYKPKEFIRLGLAVHTPSFYSLTDQYSNDLSVTDKSNIVKTASSRDYNSGDREEQQYNFRTPWKFIVSGSYVFREIQDVTKQKAFITADIEYVPYNGMRFSAKDANDVDLANYLSSRNKIIKSMYKGNFNFRIGGELKFKVWMIRAGYGYYGNPYKEDALKTNLHRISGGLGYRNRGFFVDLTYVHNIMKTADVPYRIQANTPFANVKNNMGNVIATVGFKF